MKLLYFTTANNQKQYELIQQQSRVKASVATQVFESALLSGMAQAGQKKLTLRSFPMIASFPGSKLLLWGARKQTVAGGYETTWLPTVNLFGLKQLSQRCSAARAVRKWLKENQNEKDKAVLLYSVYEPIAAPVLKYCKKSGCKAYVIVPDLPRDMYKTISKNPIKAWQQKRYMRRAVACQSKFDGYIYLTEAMAQEVAPGKPYIIMEGIADTAAFPERMLPKAEKRAIMYAGAISEKYGLKNLIEAFRQAELPDAELWLFGAGEWACEAKKLAEQTQNIRYFGRVSREEVLQNEMRATLLVNVRDPQEAFTKFSFPSKTIEYMLSGTPLLTTRLPGIPSEYEPYVFFAEDNRIDTLRTLLTQLLQEDEYILSQKGAAAREFVRRGKSPCEQATELLRFVGGHHETKKTV